MLGVSMRHDHAIKVLGEEFDLRDLALEGDGETRSGASSLRAGSKVRL